jgi:hypothetical protein
MIVCYFPSVPAGATLVIGKKKAKERGEREHAELKKNMEFVPFPLAC